MYHKNAISPNLAQTFLGLANAHIFPCSVTTTDELLCGAAPISMSTFFGNAYRTLAPAWIDKMTGYEMTGDRVVHNDEVDAGHNTSLHFMELASIVTYGSDMVKNLS